MEDEFSENYEFMSAFNIEEEQRKLFAADILYRAVKYIMGYLKGYKVVKYENFKSNPMWIVVKVYWKDEDILDEIREIEKEIQKMVIEREKQLITERYKDYKEEFQIGD